MRLADFTLLDQLIVAGLLLAVGLLVGFVWWLFRVPGGRP